MWVTSVKYIVPAMVTVAGNGEAEQAKAKEWISDTNFGGCVCKLRFVNASSVSCH